jgi:hypothetical protein
MMTTVRVSSDSTLGQHPVAVSLPKKRQWH